MGVSPTVVRHLRECGHDAVHLHELGLDRLRDDEIINTAHAQERIVLTFDLDFGDLLAANSALSASTILFRLRNPTTPNLARRLFEVVEVCTLELERGALVIVEDGRFRVRLLPIKSSEI